MDWSLPDSSGLWNFPGKNTGVYSHSLLQGVFPTQGTQVSCIAGRLFTFWARNLYFGRYLKYSSSTFQRAGETVFSHLPPLTCILVLEFLPQGTGFLRSRMYTRFHSLLFTLPTVSEKISQKTNRLRLKKFRRGKKKKQSPKELARSIHDIGTQLLSEIEKTSETAWGFSITETP